MCEDTEELTIYDFDKVCRTCLTKGVMKPLYENCSEDVCLIEMLMSCTFVQFTENDGLPVQICTECVLQINKSYDFANKCQIADAKLRKCVNEFQSKLNRRKKNTVVEKPQPKIELRRTRNFRKPKPSTPETLVINDEIEIKPIEILESSSIAIQNEAPLTEGNEHCDNDRFSNKCEAISELQLNGVVKSEDSDDSVENNIEQTNNEISIKSEDSDDCLANYVKKKLLQKNNKVLETDDSDSSVQKRRVQKNKILQKLKSQTSYECKKCDLKFANFQLLKLHRQDKNHPRNGYGRKTCKICSKSVGYSRMNQHMRIHTREKPYCCEACGARFSIGSNLRRHKLSAHSNEKPYRCDQCGRGFTRLSLLKDHGRTHTGEKPYVCNYCGKSFAQASSLRTHLFVHAKRGETEASDISLHMHQCPDCERSFATKPLLRAHLLIHGEKRFLCSDCGRSFISMILLKSHSKVHTGLKPYTCSVCGKTFSHAGSLKSHSLIHTGEKPFACSVCNRSFTQRSHLKYHSRTHSGERPYVCSVCGKTFALNGNLTVHMRTHTGETPYLCPVCGKGFHDSSSMKKHKKGHGPQGDV